MVVQNRETKVQYSMPKSSWEKLGKNQALFTVVDDRDEAEIKPQIIDNTAKPGTGQTGVVIKDPKKDKQTKETKK